VLPRLSAALVVAGLALLWTGVVRDSLGLIYLSILCTAIAGVALIVYTQVSRRRAVPAPTEDEPQVPAGPEPGGDAPSPGAAAGDPTGSQPASAAPGTPAGSEPGLVGPPADAADPDASSGARAEEEPPPSG
jgi:hypothetical protein